jgi:hypothetical protein
MRTYLLLLWLCLTAGLNALAQSRPDQILLLDKTSQNAFVDEIGETDITYFLSKDANRQNPQRILKSRVWKIVFANGDVEMINSLPSQPVQPVLAAAPDRIHTVDRTIIEAVIIRVGDITVEYKLHSAGASETLYEYPLQKVERIEFANGEVRKFGALAVTNSRKKENEAKRSKAGLEEKREIAGQEPRPAGARVEKLKLPRLSALGSRLGVSLAFVGSYVINDPYWKADTNGIGFRQGLGGMLTLQYKLTDWLALSLQGGYSQFLSKRTYHSPATGKRSTARYSLVTIPVQLGIKVYPVKSVYLGVAAGMNYQLTQFDTNSRQGRETRQFLPTGTAALGYEPRIGKLKFDIAVQYTYSIVRVTSTYAASPAIQTPQFKIGLGF